MDLFSLAYGEHFKKPRHKAFSSHNLNLITDISVNGHVGKMVCIRITRYLISKSSWACEEFYNFRVIVFFEIYSWRYSQIVLNHPPQLHVENV